MIKKGPGMDDKVEYAPSEDQVSMDFPKTLKPRPIPAYLPIYLQ